MGSIIISGCWGLHWGQVSEGLITRDTCCEALVTNLRCPSSRAEIMVVKDLTRHLLVPGGTHFHLKPSNVGSEGNVETYFRAIVLSKE